MGTGHNFKLKFPLFCLHGEIPTLTLDVPRLSCLTSLWKGKVGKVKTVLGLPAVCAKASDAQLVQELIRMLEKPDLCLIKATGQRHREPVLWVLWDIQG